MKLFFIICLINVSHQLKCDRTQVTAHIGGQFVVSCSYDTTRFLFSRKYWCRGSLPDYCEVVADSESKKSQRWTVLDQRKRGLFVHVRGLTFEDAGTYWIGIDKMYKDIMTAVEVFVTEVPVSKPSLRPLTPQMSWPSCMGEAVTVRCSANQGTNVVYVWYQQTHPEVAVVSNSPDLRLDCRLAQKKTHFYCVAKNSMGQQRSDTVFVQVLFAAENNCIYQVLFNDQFIYQCPGRLTTASITTATAFQSTQVFLSMAHVSTFNQNRTLQSGIHTWSWTTIPPWYSYLRLSLLASMLTFLLLVVICTKTALVRRIRKNESLSL